MAGKKPDYRVCVGREIEGGKTFWREIGSAWNIKDGGISVKLDAVPINGEMVLFAVSDE